LKLGGLVEADGCVRYKDNQKQNRVQYSSSSIKLIYDIIYICKKFNMIIGGCISVKKESYCYIGDNELLLNYDNYAITIPFQFKKVLKYFDYSDEVLDNTRKLFNVSQDKSLEGILKVDKFKLDSFVYNIIIKNKKYIHTLNGIIA